LRLIAKGENEGLENRVEHFDRLSTDDRWVPEGICHDKERDEQVALDNTEQDKLGCKQKIVPVEGERTRANQESIWLKGLVDEFDVGQEFACACETVRRPIYAMHCVICDAARPIREPEKNIRSQNYSKTD
jgi:hypothetical protein